MRNQLSTEHNGASETAGPQESSPSLMSYWVVAFLDLLGYRSILNEFDIFPLPPDGPQRDAANRALARAIHLRRRLLKVIHEFMEEMAVPLEFPGQEPPQEYQRLASSLRQIKIVKAAGPDHVVLACSLMPQPGHNWIRALYTLVGACAAATLLQLSMGGDDPDDSLPLRGGIDLALGSFDGDVLYSPALVGAYELESNNARYPRIIGSERFLAFLNSYAEIQDHSSEGNYVRALSGAIREMFFEEKDTPCTLDFFGEGVRKQLPDDDETREIALKAWRFVCFSESRFRATGNQHLQEKYAWLVEYMQPRLYLWGVKG